MAISVSEREGVLIFRLSGRIISQNATEVSETIEEALASHSSSPNLVFDLKQVTAMDSSGLGVMIKTESIIRPHNGQIAVINVNKRVKNLIVMAHLITVFKNFESEDDAVAALSQ